jgi:hypothetical protein
MGTVEIDKRVAADELKATGPGGFGDATLDHGRLDAKQPKRHCGSKTVAHLVCAGERTIDLKDNVVFFGFVVAAVYTELQV